MKSDWLPGFAKNTLLIVLGLIGGLSFAIMLEVGYPIRSDAQPEWCASVGPLCWAYEWQTLIAGSFAIGAAAVAWIGARNQVKASREIPIEMRRNEIQRELAKYAQIEEFFEMYVNAADRIFAFVEQRREWDNGAFFDDKRELAIIARPTSSLLEQMAIVLNMPGARAEVLNAARNIRDMNDVALRLGGAEGKLPADEHEDLHMRKDRELLRHTAQQVLITLTKSGEAFVRDREMYRTELASLLAKES